MRKTFPKGKKKQHETSVSEFGMSSGQNRNRIYQLLIRSRKLVAVWMFGVERRVTIDGNSERISVTRDKKRPIIIMIIVEKKRKQMSFFSHTANYYQMQ